MRSPIPIGCVIAVLLLLPSCRTEPHFPPNMTTDVCELRMGTHRVMLEIADDEEEKRRGLMFRKSLPKDYGMIFIFDREQSLPFWMKNTYIDLDIAFVDATGKIVDIQSMKKLSETIIVSRAKAQYAIEMQSGWFKKHGIKVGEQIELEVILPKMVDEKIVHGIN